MKCRKCGVELIKGYLGIQNRKNQLCSKCLIEEELKLRPTKEDILMW